MYTTMTWAPRASAGQSTVSGTAPPASWPVTNATEALVARWVSGMPA